MAALAKTLTPPAYLATAIAKFSPPVRAVGKAALAAMRARMPGAVELVYDNYNALVVGFSPNERPSHAVLSVVLYPRHVNLGFLQGALLDDPNKVLVGSGNQFRHIKLVPDATVLDRPDVAALVAQAIEAADAPFDRRRRRMVVIRLISKKQRPRRPHPRRFSR